jgi:hypothetical protein
MIGQRNFCPMRIKFISHRGNVKGVDPVRENTKKYIDEAIKLGYDVEIDIRTKDDVLYLGHDTPDERVTLQWLKDRVEFLWIHLKDYKSLMTFCNLDNDFRYFCHQGDDFTLVSNGLVWCHKTNNKMNNKCIIPLLSLKEVEEYNQNEFYGVCSDFVQQCKEKFEV